MIICIIVTKPSVVKGSSVLVNMVFTDWFHCISVTHHSWESLPNTSTNRCGEFIDLLLETSWCTGNCQILIQLVTVDLHRAHKIMRDIITETQKQGISSLKQKIIEDNADPRLGVICETKSWGLLLLRLKHISPVGNWDCTSWLIQSCVPALAVCPQ